MSDYEETGDTDDEREKARKKRKYQLENNSDAESGDERATVPPLKLQVQPVEVGTADGLVQASVYYEPPEEEAQVVEKVLAHRTRATKVRSRVCTYIRTCACPSVCGCVGVSRLWVWVCSWWWVCLHVSWNCEV